MSRKTLSIVIPTYNESKKIENTFSRLDRFFSKLNYEMEYVFVEDGSKDDTLAVLRELERGRNCIKVIANKGNMGKGYSVREGMLKARGDYILFVDADMSTPLRAFLDFEKYIGSHDIIIGSRWLEESNIRIPQPWYRRTMGMIFYMIIKAFFLRGITDTNCGFKCYRKDVARDIFPKQLLKGWGFDAEVLYIAQKRNYRIKEIPVVWAHGRSSKVNFFIVPILTLIELARIKVNGWKGHYDK